MLRSEIIGEFMKLNQLIAIIPSAKNEAQKKKTETYRCAQTPALFNGLSRTYQPRDEEGFVYPSESQPVHFSADKLIQQFVEGASDFINLAAMQDTANTQAKADVVVNGDVIFKDVPVTHLLFLEKQLQDIKTFVSALPVLGDDQEWTYSESHGNFVSAAKQTAKTKKVMKPVVLYDATDKHPAQVKEATEDVVEGTWTLRNFSAALPKSQVNALVSRVDALLKAVLIAREEANSIEVKKVDIATPLFKYLFS